MILVGRDGDLKNVSVVFAFVEPENVDNYSVCFRILLNPGYEMRRISIIYN